MDSTRFLSSGYACSPIGQQFNSSQSSYIRRCNSPVDRTSPAVKQDPSSPTEPLNANDCTMEYLASLLKEKKQLSVFPQMFRNVERLIEEEITRVRMVLFQCNFSTENLELPDPVGDPIVATDKVYIPVKEHPDFNFVGRILGPRGMTAKQLEHETGCKVMVRGRGSMRDHKKEEMNRGRPNWEHLNDDLHVLLQCEDTPNRVYIKLRAAADQIRKLLVPAPDGADDLKRKQLMELAIINGTYRPINSKYHLSSQQIVTPVTLVSPIRNPTQMFLSPIGSPITPSANINANTTGSPFRQSSKIDYNMLMSQISLDNALASLSMVGNYQPFGSPTSYPANVSNNTAASTPSALQPYFVDPSMITPPPSGGNLEGR